MKKIALVLGVLSALALGACNGGGNSNNNGANTTSVAAVPQGCNTPTTTWTNCTYGYNPSAYGNYPYSGYSGYYSGYGYYPYYSSYGYSGYYVPSYSSYGYGCPAGYQPMYVGNVGNLYYSSTGYTCIAVNYLGSYYTGYGYSPYYSSGYTWPSGYTGSGPVQACDAYVNNCPGGYTCQAFYGSRMGYCVVGNKY